MSVLSQQQLYQYATNAGFVGSARDTIVAIAQAESSGATTAVNTSDPNGGSYGVLQINGFWFNHGTNQACALDPQCAFNFAYNTISHQGTNFSDWGTYSSGVYQQYLGQSSNNTPTNSPTTGGICDAWVIGGIICSQFFEQGTIVLVGLLVALVAIVMIALGQMEKA